MFNLNMITKPSNVLISDPISCYQNFCAQQNHNAYEVFYNFLAEIKPARILEIGTGMGGFTMALKLFVNELNLSTTIRTYDVLVPRYAQNLSDAGVQVRIEETFHDEYTFADESLKQYIQLPGTTIVLCDGKSKTNEFRLLSNFLKPNDFILAHDYYENQEVFDNKLKFSVWNWNEICLAEIENPMKINNLVHYNKETFENVAWVCTRKENL